jgi:hypothetical protein
VLCRVRGARGIHRRILVLLSLDCCTAPPKPPMKGGRERVKESQGAREREKGGRATPRSSAAAGRAEPRQGLWCAVARTHSGAPTRRAREAVRKRSCVSPRPPPELWETQLHLARGQGSYVSSRVPGTVVQSRRPYSSCTGPHFFCDSFSCPLEYRSAGVSRRCGGRREEAGARSDCAYTRVRRRSESRRAGCLRPERGRTDPRCSRAGGPCA